MDRIDRIFDRNTDIISALVSSAFDYDMPISSKVYPVDPVYPVKFLFIELPLNNFFFASFRVFRGQNS